MIIRENVIVDGLPYVWSTNLTDDGIREFFDLYVDLIREPNPPAENSPEAKLGIRIHFPLAFLEFQEGVCLWSAADQQHTVLYRSNRDWEMWSARQEEIRELREEEAAEKAIERQLLETEDRHLVEKTNVAIKAIELGVAAACIAARMDLRLSSKGIRGLSYDWHRSSDLWWSFTQFPTSNYGVEFIRKYASRPETFAGFAHWFAARCGLPPDQCAEQTNLIYEEGMRLFPNSASLAAAACLFWRRVKRYDVAMTICADAIKKGLKDGTKSGFEARLKRLERESQKARRTED